MQRIAIAELDAATWDQYEADLARLLQATVQAGASVGFILPFSLDDAGTFWRSKILPLVRNRARIVLAASDGEAIVGTVQLVLDTPANQPHRGEVAKLLVHPDWRRRGIAKALMAALEARARDHGRHLLTLDTRTGDTAEPLYRALGYSTAGVIPGYCLDPESRGYDATTYMYKTI